MSLLEIPASPAQQRIWALAAEASGEPVYQLAWEMVNQGPLDLAALSASLHDLLARHEALRTEFHLVGGSLVQRVQPPPSRVPIEFIELAAESQAELSAAYETAMARLAEATLDLAQAPLVRLGLIRRPDLEGPPGGVYDTIVPIVHHIVADAWSCEIFSTELLGGYMAHRAGTDPGFEPVRVQCADLCAWLASRRDEAKTQQDLEFWRANLAEVTQLDLTRGRPRPASPSQHGARLDVSIDRETTDQIRRFARQRRASPFMVLYAAFSAALGRVFGSTDVAVGTNVSVRTSRQAADTIGMFLDRMVLRLDVGGQPTFDQLVTRARDVVLNAHDHAEPGFEQVVAALAPRRVPGVVPLAQVSFNIQPAFTGNRRDQAMAVHQAQQAGSDDPFRLKLAGGSRFYGIVQHDLGLDLHDGDRFAGILEHRDGVVTDADARLVWSLMGRILRAGLAAPDQPLALIQTLEPADLAAVLAAQDGGTAEPARWHLIDLVGRWVAATPDALAVDAHDGKLTYRELAGRASDLAARLRAHGVAAGQPVLVAVDRGVSLPVALLGVLASAGAYVPVDPRAPAAYLAEVATTLAARVLVTEPGTNPAVPPGLTVLMTATDQQELPFHFQRLAGVHTANAAYVLLTSGSTGRPKPVVVEHRNLGAYLVGAMQALGHEPGAVHLLIQNPAFDASLTTICGALASGGVLKIVTAETAMDPGLLAEVVSAEPIDYIKLTPTHLAALLAGHDRDRLNALRPRKAVVLGGEPVPARLADQLSAAGWELINQYGPTETTIGVLVGKLASGSASGWLGRALPNVHIYVLDEDGVQVPPGCVGELCVGGELVARGYAGAPGATAAVFCPDPYGGRARIYRTGDMVRCLGDGTFVFQGRRDRQVKIRGHRVEPAAIETVLLDQPGVVQAAVAARGDRLIGYVVLTPGQEAAGLRAALAARLPAYSRPDALVVIDRLPLTRTGKLDVAALPDPDGRELATAGRDADDGPATPTEEQLAEIWRVVLRRDVIPVTADFFELGGDSILAVRAVGEARARGIKLTMRGLLEHPTIRSLAAALPTAPDAAGSPTGGLDWAGVTTIAIDRLVDDVTADLDAYFDEGAGIARLEAAGDRCHLIFDVLRCDDRTAGALATAMTDPAAPVPPRQTDRTAEMADPGAPVPPRPADQTAEVADPAASARSVADVRRVPGDRGLARAAVAPWVHEGLRGAAHQAYGTDVTDLVVAAVGRALACLGGPAPAGLLVTDVRPNTAAELAAGQLAQPGLIEFQVDPESPAGTVVQAAKAAIRRPTGQLGTRPFTVRVLDLPPAASLISGSLPADGSAVFVAGAEVIAAASGEAGSRDLADAVALALTWIVEHCVAQSPVYAPEDFPAANLSQADLDRLLASIGTPGKDGAFS